MGVGVGEIVRWTTSTRLAERREGTGVPVEGIRVEAEDLVVAGVRGHVADRAVAARIGVARHVRVEERSARIVVAAAEEEEQDRVTRRIGLAVRVVDGRVQDDRVALGRRAILRRDVEAGAAGRREGCRGQIGTAIGIAMDATRVRPDTRTSPEARRRIVRAERSTGHLLRWCHVPASERNQVVPSAVTPDPGSSARTVWAAGSGKQRRTSTSVRTLLVGRCAGAPVHARTSHPDGG